MDKYTRIAKRITARSQIIKKCLVDGNSCLFHIEESIWMQDSTYLMRTFINDIDGFAYDVSRELNYICGAVCDKNSISLSVDKENGLLKLVYEYNTLCTDEMMERMKTSEFVVDEK